MLASATFAQSTNFSGTYQIEADKIDWGPAPHFILPATITITQTDSNVTLIRSLLDASGNVHADTLILDADGKSFHSKTLNGQDRASAMHWVDDGKTFSVAHQVTGNEGQPAGKTDEVFSLSADGQELIVDRSVDQQVNDMKYTIRAYYKKK